MTADEMLRLILTSRVYDVARVHPAGSREAAVGAHRAPGLPEARGSAADLHLQAARRLQPHRAPVGRREGPRSHHGERRQPRARRGLRRAGTSVSRPDRHAADHPRHQSDAVRELGAEVQLAGDSYAEAKARLRRARRRDRPRLRPRVRRPAGHCRPGHHRAGGPGQPAQRRRRDLRAGGRRRADCRHRQLREGRASRRPGDRRRAVRGRRDVPVAGRGPAGGARPRRASSPMAWPCARWARCPSRWRKVRSTRSCGSPTTRSARRSRTSSTTRAR